jgi:hypothetical protein
VIGVEPAGRGDGQLQGLVVGLAAGIDSLGLSRLCLLPRLGEDPLRVLVAAGDPSSQAWRPSSSTTTGRSPRSVVALLLRREVRNGPSTCRTHHGDPDQASHISEGEPLATLDLPQPPELGDALGAREGAAPRREQGAATGRPTTSSASTSTSSVTLANRLIVTGTSRPPMGLSGWLHLMRDTFRRW